MLTARPYQAASVEAVFDRLVTRDEPSTLLVLATGLGKTVVFSLVAQKWSRDHPGRVLVLAHREELISQAAAELYGILGVPPEIEMAERRAAPATPTLFDDTSPVVVASVQTRNVPLPFQPDLEAYVLPGVADIVAAARLTLGKEG